MEQLVEFAGNHVMLVAAFLFILALLSWNLIADPGSKGSAAAPTPASSDGLARLS